MISTYLSDSLHSISTIHGTQYSIKLWADAISMIYPFCIKLWKGNSDGIQLHLQTIVWFLGDVTWLHSLAKWIADRFKTFTSIFNASNWQRKKCMFSFSHIFKTSALKIRIRILVLYALPTTPDDQPMVNCWLMGLLTNYPRHILNRNPFHKDFLAKGLTTDQLLVKHWLTLDHLHFFHATATILQLRNPPWQPPVAFRNSESVATCSAGMPVNGQKDKRDERKPKI